MSTITRDTAGGIMKDDYQDPGKKRKKSTIGERIRSALAGRRRRDEDTDEEKSERSRARARSLGRLLPRALRPGEGARAGLDETLNRGRKRDP